MIATRAPANPAPSGSHFPRAFRTLGLLLFVLAAELSAPTKVKNAHGALVFHLPRNTLYDRLIREYARTLDVEAALVKAVIHAESRFDRRATSGAGARGLMQLMPRTALAYGVRDLYDPRHNIRAGTKHLRVLLKRYRNDVKLAVAAYNAGTRKVDRYRGVPPYRETRNFVARVLRYRQQYLTESASLS